MDRFARGEETFYDYFLGSLGWFVVFCVFTFLSLAMIVTR